MDLQAWFTAPQTLGALATLAMAVFTAFLAWATHKMAKASFQSLQELTRPKVLPSLVVVRKELFCLMVKNYGNGLALDVRIEVPENLEQALQGNEHARITKLDSVSLTLGPQQEMYYVIGTPATINLKELPVSVFHVSYKDGSGRTYQEEMTIDFGRIGPALLYGTPLEEAIYPVVESLKKLEEGVKDLSRAVQRLASKAVNSKDEI